MQVSLGRYRRNTGSDQGFTLIEVMIVVAIVGILAAIALPSYQESVRKGNRASARAALLDAQQFMERFYAANDRYNLDHTAPTPLAVALPSRLVSIPAEAPKYTLSISASAVNSYTLTATPISGSSQANDKCGNLTLENTGARGQSGVGATVAECWK